MTKSITRVTTLGLLAGFLLLASSCQMAGLSGPAPTAIPSPPAMSSPSGGSAALATPAILPVAGASAQPAVTAAPGSIVELTVPAGNQPSTTVAAALPASPAGPPVAAAVASNAAGPAAQPTSGATTNTQSIQYISPMPGSAYNPAGSTIALRYGGTVDETTLGARFQVTGATSGSHDGTTVLSDDHQTLIFKPDQPFAPGETVEVTVASWAAPAGAYPAASFSFVVATSETKPGSTTGQVVPQNTVPLPAGGNDGSRRYLTVPPDFPAITVTVPAQGTADGLVFASNFQLFPGPSGYYLLILDNNGEPVYYQKLAANTRVLDFKLLPDDTLAYADDNRNAYVLIDNTYREIGTVTPGNGYKWVDQHDLLLLPDGHHLLMANEVRSMDLSQVAQGGNPQAAVTAQVLQELDKDQNVVFQWRLLDHIGITDTTESLITSTLDFSHANSIEVDTDGNLLLSSRHLDEITKIDRHTGAIIWRLGGKANQFQLSLAPGVSGPVEFYHQHDVRRLPNGHISLFDNHNGHDPQVSRALEYAVDEQARTATLVWARAADQSGWAIAMGNVQHLSNGDIMIGWGTTPAPNLEEVRPDGSAAFALDLGGSDVTYRAFRFPWRGYPTWPPALVAQAGNGAPLSLTASWNGSTEVASYRVYGGNSPNPDQMVTEQPKGGFETRIQVPPDRGGYCFYRVVPVDAQGQTGPPSSAVANPSPPAGTCPGV